MKNKPLELLMFIDEQGYKHYVSAPNLIEIKVASYGQFSVSTANRVFYCTVRENKEVLDLLSIEYNG